jgi:hypothetical protein
MHYDLIIISDYDSEKIFEGINHLQLHPPHYLIGLNETDNHLTFDYLIFSNPETLGNQKVLCDQDKIITNYFFQTSLEHLFCIGPISGSYLNPKLHFQKIKDFLTDPK